MFSSSSTAPISTHHRQKRNRVTIGSAKYRSSMALGTSAIIRETTTVVKQVLKTLMYRKGGPPVASGEEGDGLDQALLDGKDEYCCEHLNEMDSHTIVRTKSWV